MISDKVIGGHLKTISALVVKGFARVDEKLDKMDGRIDRLEKGIEEVKFNVKALGEDIDDLAGMTAREFKAVRSELAGPKVVSRFQ
jgi:archaellum component FlaC